MYREREIDRVSQNEKEERESPIKRSDPIEASEGGARCTDSECDIQVKPRTVNVVTRKRVDVVAGMEERPSDFEEGERE